MSSKIITIRLNENELTAIQEYAEQEGLTLSAAIRSLVKQSLNQKIGDLLIKELARDPSLRATLHRLVVLGIS